MYAPLMRVNVYRISGLIKETTVNSTLQIPFKDEEFNIPNLSQEFKRSVS